MDETPIDIVLDVVREIAGQGMQQYDPVIYHHGQYVVVISIMEYLNNHHNIDEESRKRRWHIMDGTALRLRRTFRQMGLKVNYLPQSGMGIYVTLRSG